MFMVVGLAEFNSASQKRV